MAKKDAPNYREADNPNEKCGNCCALKGEACTKFDFDPGLDDTCDAWCPDNKSVAKVLRATARILDPESSK